MDYWVPGQFRRSWPHARATDRLSTARREPPFQIRSKDRACWLLTGRTEGAVASC
jgi:hypothetical protein